LKKNYFNTGGGEKWPKQRVECRISSRFRGERERPWAESGIDNRSNEHRNVAKGITHGVSPKPGYSTISVFWVQ